MTAHRCILCVQWHTKTVNGFLKTGKCHVQRQISSFIVKTNKKTTKIRSGNCKSSQQKLSQRMCLWVCHTLGHFRLTHILLHFHFRHCLPGPLRPLSLQLSLEVPGPILVFVFISVAPFLSWTLLALDNCRGARGSPNSTCTDSVSMYSDKRAFHLELLWGILISAFSFPHFSLHLPAQFKGKTWVLSERQQWSTLSQNGMGEGVLHSAPLLEQSLEIPPET